MRGCKVTSSRPSRPSPGISSRRTCTTTAAARTTISCPFDGVIDWPELLIAFQKVGYDGTLMFELAAAADGPSATLRRAGAVRRRIESLLGQDAFSFSEE